MRKNKEREYKKFQRHTVILWFCVTGMFCPPSNISRQVLTAIARIAEAHTLVGLTFIKSMM